MPRIDLQLAQAAPVVQEQVQQIAVNAPVAITTLDTAFQGIAQSQEMFPVDFEQAWKWIGYSTKGQCQAGGVVYADSGSRLFAYHC
jgi:hypothetical protein